MGVNERRPARRAGLLVVLATVALGVFALVPAANAGGLPGSNTLTVQLQGTGAGTVVQSSGPGNGTPQGIKCTKAAGGSSPSTGVCNESIPFGEPPAPWVGLTAQPPAGSVFVNWTVSGPGPGETYQCGNAAQCFFQVSGDVNVRATFTQTPQTPVTVVLAGGSAGNAGTVTSSPAGISCSHATTADCSASFPIGSQMTLTAFPPSGTSFGGWSAPTGFSVACAQGNSTPTCTLPIGTNPIYVVASFNTVTFALGVTLNGQGGVTSNVQPGISCNDNTTGTCSANFASGTVVTLTAAPDPGQVFNGWGGACSGNSATCVVTMSAAQSVTANFQRGVIQASVGSVNAVKRHGVRYIRVTIVARQELRLRINARQGRRVVAGKSARNFGPIRSRVQLVVRRNARAGSTRVTIRLTAPGVQGRTVVRNVRLPRA